MRKFITELKGKTVMTNDGQILGMIDNFVVDTVTGEINHALVVPPRRSTAACSALTATAVWCSCSARC